jgi:hypothetical protein
VAEAVAMTTTMKMKTMMMMFSLETYRNARARRR